MSWQEYVDVQICNEVQCNFAVIAGLQDGAIWAKNEKAVDSPVTQEEMKAIADAMHSNPGLFQSTGIRIAGSKYISLSSDAHLVRGRKGSSALCIVATNTCLIAAAAADGVPAGTLNTVVEKLGDYLRQSNF